jgi:hypothetical protein
VKSTINATTTRIVAIDDIDLMAMDASRKSMTTHRRVARKRRRGRFTTRHIERSSASTRLVDMDSDKDVDVLMLGSAKRCGMRIHGNEAGLNARSSAYLQAADGMVAIEI